MVNYGLRGAIFDWINDPKNDSESHKLRFIRLDCIPLSDETWEYLEEVVPEHDFWEIGELDEYACLEGISVFYLRELHRHGWLNEELQAWHDRIESNDKTKGKIPCENYCCDSGPKYGLVMLDYIGANTFRECNRCIERKKISQVLAAVS